MLTIRKISGFVILTGFFLSRIFAENGIGNYGFSLSPNIGFLYGHAEEIVYKDPPYQNYYLSELLWDLKPLIYAGLGADFGPLDPSMRQGFAAALSIKAGLPIKTGIIEDRDWLNPDIDIVTWYSQHDAYSASSFLLDVSVGYFRRFANSLGFNVFGEFSYMHFSWLAKDGYYQYTSTTSEGYPPWNSNLPKDNYYGEAIRYKQDWFIFSPGLSLTWKINRLFSLKAQFCYSPLIYCADRDDHLLGNRTFIDYLFFGRYLKPGGELLLTASENTSLSLSMSYKHITGLRGDTFYQSRRYEDEAGAGYSAIDLGLAVKFRLRVRD